MLVFYRRQVFQSFGIGYEVNRYLHIISDTFTCLVPKINKKCKCVYCIPDLLFTRNSFGYMSTMHAWAMHIMRTYDAWHASSHIPGVYWVFHLEFFRCMVGPGEAPKKALSLVPLFSRARGMREVQGGMLLAAHSYAKKEGLGMRLLRSLAGFAHMVNFAFIHILHSITLATWKF